MLDHFETIGLLMRKQAIDAQAVWSVFSHYIVNYYFHCEQTRFFAEWLGDDSSFYEDFRALHARMQDIKRDDPEDDFLDEEMKFLPDAEQGLAV